MQLKGKLLGDFLTNAPSHGGGICVGMNLFC